MTTEEILQLDCREPGNIEKIKLLVCRLPMFAKYQMQDITIEKLERLVYKYQGKYKFLFENIGIHCYGSDGFNYCARVWLQGQTKCQLIYASSLYELMAKIVIYMYSQVKKGKVEER